MIHRRALLFSAANALLASSHLLVPSYDTYAYQRAFQALARSFQGPLEFVSFSILTTAGVLSGLSFMLAITILAFAAAKLAQTMWNAGHEIKEILPFAVALYLGVGIASTYAGDVPVGHPIACRNLPAPTVAQKVITFPERGWEPGAYYFLLETDPGLGRWRQVTSKRIDLPVADPCWNIQDIFPQEGISPDAA